MDVLSILLPLVMFGSLVQKLPGVGVEFKKDGKSMTTLQSNLTCKSLSSTHTVYTIKPNPEQKSKTAVIIHVVLNTSVEITKTSYKDSSHSLVKSTITAVITTTEETQLVGKKEGFNSSSQTQAKINMQEALKSHVTSRKDDKVTWSVTSAGHIRVESTTKLLTKEEAKAGTSHMIASLSTNTNANIVIGGSDSDKDSKSAISAISRIELESQMDTKKEDKKPSEVHSSTQSVVDMRLKAQGITKKSHDGAMKVLIFGDTEDNSTGTTHTHLDGNSTSTISQAKTATNAVHKRTYTSKKVDTGDMQHPPLHTDGTEEYNFSTVVNVKSTTAGDKEGKEASSTKSISSGRMTSELNKDAHMCMV